MNAHGVTGRIIIPVKGRSACDLILRNGIAIYE